MLPTEAWSKTKRRRRKQRIFSSIVFPRFVVPWFHFLVFSFFVFVSLFYLRSNRFAIRNRTSTMSFSNSKPSIEILKSTSKTGYLHAVSNAIPYQQIRFQLAGGDAITLNAQKILHFSQSDTIRDQVNANAPGEAFVDAEGITVGGFMVVYQWMQHHFDDPDDAAETLTEWDHTLFSRLDLIEMREAQKLANLLEFGRLQAMLREYPDARLADLCKENTSISWWRKLFGLFPKSKTE